MKILLTAILSLAFIGTALADAVKVGNLHIDDVWARPTLRKGAPTGAFLSIKNMGATPDRLLSVSSSLAKVGEIHQSSMSNGVMKMRRVDQIDIPAGGMVMLAPGGYHVMLMGTKSAIKPGGHVPLTLTFEKAGKVMLHADVRALGDKKMKHEMKHSD